MRMGTNGNGKHVRGVSQVPPTARGRELLAFLKEKCGSLKGAALATGLHYQSVRRSVFGEPGAQSVSTHDALVKLGVPPRLLSRAS